ncbi:MAG: GGDEF domain-containing protein [Spirochaetes bacterium]|nr:GGDEF domain-containing protein [Spirochaetota bacterium]HOD15602.1 GGDEF domain-containing protein [Spirochaetota bacterium]
MNDILRNLHIFNGLNDSEYARLGKSFDLVSFEKNGTISTQDHENGQLFIVVEGTVTSTIKPAGGIERKQGEFHPGDFFGEISLCPPLPLIVTYRAIENCRLISISRQSLMELIDSDPDIAIPVLTRFIGLTTRRLRKSSKFLSDVVQWGEIASRRIITDDLTGVYSRIFLEDALENFFSISKSNNKPLSLLMLDIDNCRKINEEFGLETGNRIIVEIAGIIKNCISDYGIIARYGGDEFSILLPEADVAKATGIALRILQEIEGRDFSRYFHGQSITITASIGISSFPETATDLSEFKKNADTSLYHAKESGRNRVECIR